MPTNPTEQVDAVVEARELLAKATPWPWRWVAGRTRQHLHGPDGNLAQISMPIPKDRVGEEPRDDYRAVAELIAHAPRLLNQLCDELEAETGRANRWERRAKEMARDAENDHEPA